MQYTRFSIFFAAIVLSLKALALDVTTTAGQLSSVVDDIDISSLKVTGTINAADFHFINNKLENLEQLDLSDAIIETYEGERVLSGATSFAANTIPPYAFIGMILSDIKLPATLEAIDEAAFASTFIQSIVIPESVKSIGASAFISCEYLTSITLPAAVNSLGANMFSGCVSLQSANIQGLPTEIPTRMFYGCAALKSINIPTSVTSIGNQAFSGASSLFLVNFPAGLTSIGNHAFYNTAIREVDLTKCTQLKSVGDFAFAKCPSLLTVYLSNATSELGRGLFFDDFALASITLPADTEIIPEFTFKGNTDINTKLEFPATVSEIGDYALTGWTRHDKITLPANLTYIGEGAMADWESLNEIDATNVKGVPALGENVWENVDPEKVTVFVNSSDYNDFNDAPQWNEFTIKTRSTDDLTIIAPIEESSITYRFNGSILRLVSNTEPFAEVTIYDLAGRRRFALTNTPEKTVDIDIKALGSETFIVSAALADGTGATIKIAVN